MAGAWGSMSGAGSACGSACGSTAFTSAMATIGRKRTNRQNSVKNRPKLPMKVAKSQMVGWK